MTLNLKTLPEKVRLKYYARIAEVLVRHPNVSYRQISQQFGIDDGVICKARTLFNVPPRKPGRKPVMRIPIGEVCPRGFAHNWSECSHTVDQCVACGKLRTKLEVSMWTPADDLEAEYMDFIETWDFCEAE